ncbi:hypothetical protein B0H11DRAFT_1905081 [Mycena galericulata]|nr:hypothetical protein B0H11DRAFT_1905081 [Mycena galericulata]
MYRSSEHRGEPEPPGDDRWRLHFSSSLGHLCSTKVVNRKSGTPTHSVLTTTQSATNAYTGIHGVATVASEDEERVGRGAGWGRRRRKTVKVSGGGKEERRRGGASCAGQRVQNRCLGVWRKCKAAAVGHGALLLAAGRSDPNKNHAVVREDGEWVVEIIHIRFESFYGLHSLEFETSRQSSKGLRAPKETEFSTGGGGLMDSQCCSMGCETVQVLDAVRVAVHDETQLLQFWMQPDQVLQHSRRKIRNIDKQGNESGYVEMLNCGECEVSEGIGFADATEGHAKRLQVIESDWSCRIMMRVVPNDETASAQGSALRKYPYPVGNTQVNLHGESCKLGPWKRRNETTINMQELDNVGRPSSPYSERSEEGGGATKPDTGWPGFGAPRWDDEGDRFQGRHDRHKSDNITTEEVAQL